MIAYLPTYYAMYEYDVDIMQCANNIIGNHRISVTPQFGPLQDRIMILDLVSYLLDY